MKYKSKRKKKNRIIMVILIPAVIVIAAAVFCFVVYLKNSDSQTGQISGGENSFSADAETDDEAGTETAEPLVLTDQFTEYDDCETLLIYSGEALCEMEYPELTLFNDQLLLREENYYEGEGSNVTLTLIDISTGKITAETNISCEFVSDVAVFDDKIILCDSALGTITEFDENLNVTNEWQLEADYNAWYIGGSGRTLYHATDDGDLIAYDLDSAASVTLLSSSISLYGSLSGNGGVEISYTDETTELSYELWLDLDSGELSEPAFSDGFDWLTYCGSGWLASINTYDGNIYYFGNDENPYVTVTDSGSFFQPEGGNYIVFKSSDESIFTLYDYSGNFISQCEFPGDDIWFYSDCCIWCEELKGYFMLAYSDDGPELFFWDINVQTEGEDLSVVTYEEYNETPGGTSADADLYDRAAALSEAYGIEILIADQCAVEYEEFSTVQVSDTGLITAGLDLLEESLANYPDGFFEQLCTGKMRSIQINLTGTLTSTGSGWETGSFNGVTEEKGDSYVMVIDLNLLEDMVFYHEFSHIIDQKLEWDSYCREDALYSEDTWLSFNPDGFEYEYDYNTFSDYDYDETLYNYFIDTYSMVSPTEDRAQIMGCAMTGASWIFENYAPLAEKLDYYSRCIRDAFDTAGWPETTVWEAALN